MSYSCPDFVDDVLRALGIVVPAEHNDDPEYQAELAVTAIKNLQTLQRGTWSLDIDKDDHGYRYNWRGPTEGSIGGFEATRGKMVCIIAQTLAAYLPSDAVAEPHGFTAVRADKALDDNGCAVPSSN